MDVHFMRKSNTGTEFPTKIAIGNALTPSTIAPSPATIATATTANSTPPTRSKARPTGRPMRLRIQEDHHGGPSLTSSKILETMIVPPSYDDAHSSSLLPVKKNLMGVMFLANMASASHLATKAELAKKEQREDSSSQQRHRDSCERVPTVTPSTTRSAGDEGLVSHLQSYPSFDDEDYYSFSSDDDSSLSSMEEGIMTSKSPYAQPTPIRPPACDSHRLGHTPAIQEVDEESIEELEKQEEEEAQRKESHVKKPPAIMEIKDTEKRSLDRLVWLRWVLLLVVISVLAAVAAVLTFKLGKEVVVASPPSSSNANPQYPPEMPSDEPIRTVTNPDNQSETEEPEDKKGGKVGNVFVAEPIKNTNGDIDAPEDSANIAGLSSHGNQNQPSQNGSSSNGCEDQFDSGTFPCLTNIINDMGAGDDASSAFDFMMTSNGGTWEGADTVDVNDIHWSIQYEDMIGGQNGGVKVEVVSNLDPSSQWQYALETTMADWEESGAVEFTTSSSMAIEHELSSVKSPIDDILCNPLPGKLKICQGDYGETEWNGFTLVVLQEDTIVASSIRLNNRNQPDTDAFVEYEWERYSLCHQMGHALGLTDTDDDSCMSHIDVNPPPETYQRPSQGSYESLLTKYGNIRQRQLRRESTRLSASTNENQQDGIQGLGFKLQVYKF